MAYELETNQTELKQVMLALVTCRSNVKKGFKRNYGLLGHREKINVYDSLKDKVINLFIDLEEQEEKTFFLELTLEEVNMLNSFLNFYITSLRENELKAEQEIIVVILERSYNKVKLLIEMIKEEQETCLVN